MASYVTAQVLIDRIIRLSGQVPGAAVQVYSNDVFLDMINTTVRMVARKAWWPHLMDWLTGVLDGETGVVTTDLVGTADHTDIKAVFIDSSNQPLPLFSDSNSINGGYSQRLGYEMLPYLHPQYATRLIRLVPVDATGTLTLRVRKVPATLSADDIVPFDQDLIIFGTLWSYFEDEGDNPQQAKKYQSLFDAKFTELMSSISNHRVPIDEMSDGQGGADIWIVNGSGDADTGTGGGSEPTPSLGDLVGEF